jgi:hypothetical protein
MAPVRELRFAFTFDVTEYRHSVAAFAGSIDYHLVHFHGHDLTLLTMAWLALFAYAGVLALRGRIGRSLGEIGMAILLFGLGWVETSTAKRPDSSRAFFMKGVVCRHSWLLWPSMMTTRILSLRAQYSVTISVTASGSSRSMASNCCLSHSDQKRTQSPAWMSRRFLLGLRLRIWDSGTPLRNLEPWAALIP